MSPSSPLLSFLVVLLLFVAVHTIAAPIPGIEYVGRGVDITTMQVGLFQIVDNQYLPWYFWTNPFTNQSYNVPEMMFAETVTESAATSETKAFSDFVDYQTWEEHHYSWSSGFLGMDSHSKTTYNYLGQKYTANKNLAMSSLSIMYYKLWAPIPIPSVTTEFQQLVNSLPANLTTDADYNQYCDFFHQVGSAIMTEAYMGGMLTANTWYEDCLLQKHHVQWVTEQSGWSFLGIIGSHSGSGSGTNTVSANFSACSATTTTFHGGESSSVSTPLKWKEWANTIMNNPIPVRFNVQPIYAAVSWDSNKAAVMQQALQRFQQDANVTLTAYINALAQQSQHINFTTPDCCK